MTVTFPTLVSCPVAQADYSAESLRVDALTVLYAVIQLTQILCYLAVLKSTTPAPPVLCFLLIPSLLLLLFLLHLRHFLQLWLRYCPRVAQSDLAHTHRTLQPSSIHFLKSLVSDVIYV